MKIKVLLIVMLLLTGCPYSYTETNKGTFDYFEVDGMTCLRSRDGTQFSGLTCDWSQWNGETSITVKEIEEAQ